MHLNRDRSPVFQLAAGTEQVNLDIPVELDYGTDRAITLLQTFAENHGVFRIDSSQDMRPLALTYAEPAHFSNFPRTNPNDQQPWDVIIQPETTITPAVVADAVYGSQLNGTRYIFPNDGLILDQSGFTDTLVMDNRTADRIQDNGMSYYQAFRSQHRNRLKRWLSATIITDLNKRANLPPVTEAKPAQPATPTPATTYSVTEEMARMAYLGAYIDHPKVITSKQKIAQARQDWCQKGRNDHLHRYGN